MSSGVPRTQCSILRSYGSFAGRFSDLPLKVTAEMRHCLALRPGGTPDNSPAIHRWVPWDQPLGPRPGGTPEGHRGIFKRPSGTRLDIFMPSYPAMNRWAIVGRPSGTKRGTRCFLAPTRNGRVEADPAKDTQALSTQPLPSHRGVLAWRRDPLPDGPLTIARVPKFRLGLRFFQMIIYER